VPISLSIGSLQSAEPLLVIDKLTYAGNRQNLASVEAQPTFSFEKIDICGGEAIGQAAA
jgi:dTDP-glucose 4,6-dehydratase